MTAHPARRRPVLGSQGVALALALVALVACGPTAPVPPATASPVAVGPSATPVAPSAVAPASAIASPVSSSEASADTGGFAFSVGAILDYYRGQGYACSEPQPSTTAAGYTFRSCSWLDPAGRTRTVGVVTGPAGVLADAFASVRGTADESVLEPTDALDPLAGFLGATLGEAGGAAQLTWLARHLGDDYAETTAGDLKLATYTAAADDHTTLYVELANAAYLDAPTPSSR